MSATPKQEQGGGEDDTKWTITVVVDGHAPLQMKVKPTTPFLKVAAAYAKQKGLSVDAVRFLSPDGHRLDNKKTIEQNGLEDGDEVEGRIEQHGGGRHGCGRV